MTKNNLLPMLQVRHVDKFFGSTKVLDDICLDVAAGEVIAIIGPSGSGKSTFLRCLNTLETVSSGEIAVDGQNLVRTENGKTVYSEAKQLKSICNKMGMVFQSFNLFPHFTVLENIIEAPVLVKKISRQQALAEAEALLAKVGLLEKKDAYPNTLSGGQKQRVAIARALAMEPQIMLFDEPTSALDPELTGEVLDTMQKLAQEKITMLVVTHEMGFAKEVADRVVFMDHGKILAVAEAKQFFTAPTNERIVGFLDKML